MAKKARATDAAANDNPNITAAEAAASIGLNLAHQSEHAVLLDTPKDVEAYHNLMHLFLDTQAPALAEAAINLLKESGIYANSIKPRRDEFKPEGKDTTEFVKGYMQGVSLANAVILTMVRLNVTQAMDAVKDAPPHIKIEALNSVFRTTIEAGMLSIAILTASKRAFKIEGSHAAFMDASIANTDMIVHSFGMPVAEQIIVETTVPPGATVN